VNRIKYKYSLTFQKKGLLIFLSHLDLMRLFARALQRSGLPLAYSEGFNPRPRYALPYPLPVGCAGDAEILEIYLTAPLEPDTLMAKLNAHLPAEARIIDAAPGTVRPEYCLRVALDKDFVLPSDWPELVLEKSTKRGRVDRYILGEHLKLEIQNRELFILPVSGQPLKAVPICALLGLSLEDIGGITRIKKEAVLHRLS
jgi:hypothetical protein